MADFDGDGRKDIAVFRPSNGTWYIQGSSAGYWSYQYGLPGDVPVPGDYNGYGKAGAAVFRVSNSTWYIAPVGAAPYQLEFGLHGDIPVPGDYDGDGKTDEAVFRPWNGTWYIQGSRLGYWEYQWGLPGDIPVPGDYDGDGRVDAAVFRPSNSTWYVSTTSSGSFSFEFGNPGDIPVATDFDGDGKTDVAVFRPSNGTWYIQGTHNGYWQYQWGLPEDIPLPGDYDGDGLSDAAVFRPSNNTWYISATSAGTSSRSFGTSGDIPLVSNYLTFLNSATPTVSLTNLTHPNLSPDFEVGDTFQLRITGAPNQPVSVAQTANGSTQIQSFGNTDAYGHLTVDYTEQTSNIGSYTQVWSVGNSQATPAVSFMVGQLGTGGTVSTTDLGETPDGHVEGVSTVSITNGTASTYSATELDYTASLYYDAGTVGTLYEEGVAIRSGSASGSGLADGYMSAPVSAWKDYDLQTDHYVVAYIPYGVYFENPLYYQDGSCGDVTSDCTFGPGGGIYYIAAASLYLGSTLADQTNVPQDGSNIPLVDDSAYNPFLASAQQPVAPGLMTKVDSWTQAIRNVIPALFLAESVYDSQGQVNTYPLPLFLELVNDVQTPWIAPNPVRRTRTYVVKDTKGHRWIKANPLTIYEAFTKVGGQGVLPPPNAPPTGAGWTTSDGIESDSTIEDEYGFQAPGQLEVDYWQQYWATGFKAPGTILPSIPGLNYPAIPLMIKDTLSKCKAGFFGTQGVELRPDYVGINGDKGPGMACAN